MIGFAAQAAAALDDVARREIDYLLTRLETSDCRFFRNEEWYGAKRARKHLEKKLAWLAERDLITSAVQFIERAATKSTRSGEAYLVHCGGASIVPSAVVPGAVVPSAVWLMNELTRYRQAAAEN